VLHRSVSVDGPTQSSPNPDGGGESQFLCLDLVPPPHVLLHDAHAPQLPHSPLTPDSVVSIGTVVVVVVLVVVGVVVLLSMGGLVVVVFSIGGLVIGEVISRQFGGLKLTAHVI